MPGVNDGVQEPMPVHVLALIDAASRRMSAFMGEAMAADGVALRGAQLRLLSLTPEGGLRMTDLAERARMTKQSLGELVSALTDSGHLEVVHDPEDRRVRLVRPTSPGRLLAARVEQRISELEASCAEQVGPRRWATFCAVLGELAAQP